MRSLTIFVITLFVSLFQGQIFAQTPQVTDLQIVGERVKFETDNGNTAQEAEGFKYKLFSESVVIPFIVTCSGTVKPWTCESLMNLPLKLGTNTYEITVANADGTSESIKSSSLIIYRAVSQVVKETEVQSVLRCKPGSYKVGRYTGVNGFTTALNSEQAPVVSFFATAAAIYFISCDLATQ